MWYPWAPGRPPGPTRLTASLGVAKSMATKFLAFFVVLRFERCCPKQNTVAIAKNENISKTAVTFLVFDSMFVNSYCTT